MNDTEEKYQVSLFRPNSERMKGEVIAILSVLALWGSATFGFQLWLMLSADNSGKSPLETFTFFNLPFHFWFTAQMLPLFFIIICALFNLFLDRLAGGRKRDREGFYD